MKLKVATAACLIVIAVSLASRQTKEPESASAPASPDTRPRPPRQDAPFWNSAVVPESENFREPLATEVGQRKFPAVDHSAEVARLEAAGDFHSLNFALVGWFDADPIAARDWLVGRASLDSFHPALKMIAGKIAETGELANALQWANLLPPGPEQEQSLFDIYALAARAGRFTEEQLRAAPLPPERVLELLSGAPGD